MLFRKVDSHISCDTATIETAAALGYPVTEMDGMWFWMRILDRCGLLYLCSPKHDRAPDAYFALRSRLDRKARELIRCGLESGDLEASLLETGVVIAVEFESRASYAKKHFARDGADFISLICCNVNDWADAPVPVWSLEDHFSFEPTHAENPTAQVPAAKTGMLQGALAADPQPLDDVLLERLRAAVRSDNQRLLLAGFVAAKSRVVHDGDAEYLELSTKDIKKAAEAIAKDNGLRMFQDAGGVLTGFTQEGLLKDLSVLQSKRRDGKSGIWWLNRAWVPYVVKIAEELGIHLQA